MADGIFCGALAAVCSRDIFLLRGNYGYLSGLDCLPPDLSRATIGAEELTLAIDEKTRDYTRFTRFKPAQLQHPLAPKVIATPKKYSFFKATYML